MKTVVITGVSRGLGNAMALEFARLGHKVIGCARTAKALHELSAAMGKPHEFGVVDVADDHQVGAWAKRMIAVHGPPDLLINNAAIINRLAPLWKITEQEFSEIVDVNLKGVTNVIRHFVPGMVGRGKGVIVNFSSGWGRSTDSKVAPYCATKFAIEGLTQALAQDLPHGMAAIPLNPGIIDTEMLRDAFGTSASNYPTATKWAVTAVPFLLTLGTSDNGQPLTVPQS